MPTPRILLIDDDAAVRDALRTLLISHGYVVDMAANGREALDACRVSGAPDAIVLDLMMPVMSGLEFLEAKAADERLRAVPVLILTAHDHESVQLRHVLGLFRKPRDIRRLIDALDQHLGMAR